VTGDVLVGFDDDSWFMEPDSTSRVVERFNREPDLGLIEFQDIGPEYPGRIDANGPGRLRGERHVSSFGAGRYAVRRKAIEDAGVFPEFFWHAYEEPDLAVRIWDRGYRCLAWYDVVVWHEYSGVNRNERRTHYFHARNELLSCLMRVPSPYVIPLAMWRMASQARYSLSRGWGTVELEVWRDAARLAPRAIRERRPVSSETLRRCLLLNRRRVADPAEAWALGRRESKDRSSRVAAARAAGG
jgi:GT2 family glycosyltransferase